jgi:hypothetical protein
MATMVVIMVPIGRNGGLVTMVVIMMVIMVEMVVWY